MACECCGDCYYRAAYDELREAVYRFIMVKGEARCWTDFRDLAKAAECEDLLDMSVRSKMDMSRNHTNFVEKCTIEKGGAVSYDVCPHCGGTGVQDGHTKEVSK